MNYQYSKVVEPGTYSTDGLSLDIPLRIHSDPYKEIFGALQAQRDWTQQVGPIGEYLGGLGPLYSFIRITVPECRPERLEIISYANEFAFLYDDEMEKLDLRSLPGGEAELLDVFSDNNALRHHVETDTRPEKRIQSQILKHMMEIDPERAVTSMKAWATFVQLASRTRTRAFETLAEYLPSRIIDAGELIWYGTLTFAMALTIPEEELDHCFNIARQAYAAISLTNDLYSWKKERKAAEDSGLDYVFNTIWVIMKEQSVTEEVAIERCKKEITEHMLAFSNALKDIETLGLSQDTVTYLHALRSSYIGNLVWSIYCPRYQECPSC